MPHRDATLDYKNGGPLVQKEVFVKIQYDEPIALNFLPKIVSLFYSDLSSYADICGQSRCERLTEFLLYQ